jgi:hypothetical protein
MGTNASSADVLSLRHRGLLFGTEHQVKGQQPTFERPKAFVIEKKGSCIREDQSTPAGIKCEVELKRCTLRNCSVCSRPSYEGMRVCEFSLVGPWTLWEFTAETRRPEEEFKTFFEAIVARHQAACQAQAPLSQVQAKTRTVPIKARPRFELEPEAADDFGSSASLGLPAEVKSAILRFTEGKHLPGDAAMIQRWEDSPGFWTAPPIKEEMHLTGCFQCQAVAPRVHDSHPESVQICGECRFKRTCQGCRRLNWAPNWEKGVCEICAVNTCSSCGFAIGPRRSSRIPPWRCNSCHDIERA